METHSRILAWEIPWTEEPGGLQSIGCKESDTTEGLNNKPSSNAKGMLSGPKLPFHR